MSRTESLRIKADYTGTEIELTEATEVVQNAELFVQTVQRVFSLDGSPASKDDDKVSEPLVAESETKMRSAKFEPISLEEIRRQARENWLQLRQQKVGAAKGIGDSKDADRGTKEYPGHSIDDDVEQ